MRQPGLFFALLAAALWSAVAVTPAIKTALAAPSPSRPHAPIADEQQIQNTLVALGREFIRTETDRFVVLSDGDPAWTRSRAALLETTADRFQEAQAAMGLTFTPPRNKLLCLLIEDHARFEAFAAAQDGVMSRWIGGYYAVKTNRIVFFDPRTAPDFEDAGDRLDAARQRVKDAESSADRARREGKRDVAQAYRAIANKARQRIEGGQAELGAQAARSAASKTVHEAAHLLAFNCGLQMRSRVYPFWISEGFATCFEPSDEQDARRGRFGPDTNAVHRQRAFVQAAQDRRLVPLRSLLTILEPPPHDVAQIAALYAQAHALFRFLYQEDPKAIGALFIDLSREPTGDPTPARLIQLFEARFGDLERVESRWWAWATQNFAAAARVADAPPEP